MSGVTISPEVREAFTEMKLRKKYGYLIIKLDSTKTKLELMTGPRGASVDDFANAFKDDECAYGVFDSPSKNKLVGIHWNPDNAPVKSKMSSASTAKTVQDKLEGLGNLSQATDRSEVKELCK